MRRRTRPVVTVLKVIRRLRDALVVIVCLGGMVAIGTPRSAFIVLFSLIGAAFLLFWVFPLFLEYGLPRLLRRRSDSEVERTQMWVFGVVWVSVFIAAPIVWSAFFGGPDPPVSVGDVLGFGVLIAVVWLVVWLVARRRRRAAPRPRQEAEPRWEDGLFPGVTLIARPIAWLLERREAKRLEQRQARARGAAREARARGSTFL